MDAALAVRRNAEEYRAAVGGLGEWLSQKASEPAPEKSKEETSEQRESKLEAALIAKEMGNALFAKGRYEKALAAYSQSLALDDTQGAVYGNRALVWLKLECFTEAEKDCSEALDRLPKSVKFLWRRGIARRELERYNEAKEDLDRALVLEPTNKGIKDELQKVMSLLDQQASKEDTKKKMAPQAVQKTQEKGQTRRPVRRRILIEEIGEPEPQLPVIQPTEQKDAEIAPAAEKTVEETLIPAFKSLVTQEKLAVPTSFLDFERDYQSVKGDPKLWASYVRMIPPASYPALFKNAFETDHLSSFFQAISGDLLPAGDFVLAFDILNSLKSVERFSMARMFLLKADKALASQVFDTLEAELKEKPVKALRSQSYKC